MFKCNSGFDECDCSCHREAGVYHCMPCCHICPNCGRRINISSYPFHIDGCKEEQDKQNKELTKVILRNSTKKEIEEWIKNGEISADDCKDLFNDKE